MPETDLLKLPYPAPSDAADVPADMQALAEAVENSRRTGFWGSSVVDGQQFVDTTTPTVLGTPDRVSNVPVTPDTLLNVFFFGLGWSAQSSAEMAAHIYVDGESVAASAPRAVSGPGTGTHIIIPSIASTVPGEHIERIGMGWNSTPKVVAGIHPLTVWVDDTKDVTVEVRVRRTGGSGGVGLSQRRLFVETRRFAGIS